MSRLCLRRLVIRANGPLGLRSIGAESDEDDEEDEDDDDDDDDEGIDDVPVI